MKADEFKHIVDETHKQRTKLCVSKSHDYATVDCLSNFKRLQQLCALLRIQPMERTGDTARFLVLLKLDRWCNLLGEGKSSENEGVFDTVKDLHNYLDLAFACDIEEKVRA